MTCQCRDSPELFAVVCVSRYEDNQCGGEETRSFTTRFERAEPHTKGASVARSRSPNCSEALVFYWNFAGVMKEAGVGGRGGLLAQEVGRAVSLPRRPLWLVL